MKIFQILGASILILLVSCQNTKTSESSTSDSVKKEESTGFDKAIAEDASTDTKPTNLTAEQLLAGMPKQTIIYENVNLKLYHEENCDYNEGSLCYKLGIKSDGPFYTEVSTWYTNKEAFHFFRTAYSIFPSAAYVNINLNEDNQIDAWDSDFQRKYFVSELNKDAYYAINSPSGIKYLAIPYGYSQQIGSSRMTNKVYYLPRNVVLELMKALETQL